MHFVYVTSVSDKDTLMRLGYRLLKADEKNKLWIFDALPPAGTSTATVFSQLENKAFFSNTITF